MSVRGLLLIIFLAGVNAKAAKPDPGYDIFVIAGQSNSVGIGIGPFNDPNSNPKTNALIFQIGRDGANNLKVIPATDRLEHWIVLDAAGNSTSGVGMGAAFARIYAKEILKSGRKILLVPAGLGATSSLQWDREIDFFKAKTSFIDSLVLTDDLVARLNVALEQPGGVNRLKGILWHQGESDVECLEKGNWCNGKTPNGSAYATRIKTIFEFLRSKVPYAVPIVAGKFVPEWSGGSRSAAARKLEIENAIGSLASFSGHVAVVETSGLKANSQADSGSTDTIHFSAQSQIDLGKRYFEAFKKLNVF